MHASKMFNYTLNDNGTLVTYGGTAADYQTDVLADRAVDSINEAALRQPFFLSITPKAPHADEPPGYAIPAPRYLGAFADKPLPRRPSFNEADVSDKPSFIRSLPRLTASRINEIKVRYQSRLESLLAVDDLVQRVANALANTGVLDNTVLMFTSDNGYFHGEHRIPNNKEKVYEEAARVPLLIRGGGFPPGVTANQYVSNIDLAPTIVSLAGATPRLVMDGRSLLPLAQNPNLATTRSLLIEHQTYKAVRNHSFVYVEHNTGERELYDMRAGTANYDPYQLNSRHANSNYNQIKSQLRTKLNQLRACSGTTCAVQ
jgi:arylsulfatase A-like enzyme